MADRMLPRIERTNHDIGSVRQSRLILPMQSGTETELITVKLVGYTKIGVRHRPRRYTKLFPLLLSHISPPRIPTHRFTVRCNQQTKADEPGIQRGRESETGECTQMSTRPLHTIAHHLITHKQSILCRTMARAKTNQKRSEAGHSLKPSEATILQSTVRTHAIATPLWTVSSS